MSVVRRHFDPESWACSRLGRINVLAMTSLSPKLGLSVNEKWSKK
jgi:hypothetical protein